MISLLWKEWKQNRLIFALGLLVPVLFSREKIRPAGGIEVLCPSDVMGSLA